ncbi:MAG: reverse transcriptase domain-containing protein [Candidatus Thiodiazotropha sp.]
MGLNSQSQTDVILLDFSKAFDKVPHKRLALKLQHYGVRGNILEWIKSFLDGRTQQVVLDGIASSAAPVTSGVPQGTVLGPLLFLVCINDLPSSVKSSPHHSADDCLLYGRINSSADTKALQRT